jgi:hypothetical protein
LALGRCLEKLNFQQILAMIDKRYANHREGFRNPISTEMIEAVTVTGSPCEGITASKDPTVQCPEGKLRDSTPSLGKVLSNAEIIHVEFKFPITRLPGFDSLFAQFVILARSESSPSLRM